MAKVPDDRLDRLAAMCKSKNVVPASVQFVDIGGLVEGASKGEGLGNKFLGQHPRGRRHRVRAAGLRGRRRPRPVRPARAPAASSRLELALADLETVESQIDKRRKRGQAATSRSATRSTALGRAPSACLEEGTPLYRAGRRADDATLLKPYFLLTNKPVLAVVNVGEDELDRHRRRRSPRCAAELGGARRGASACACSSRPRRRQLDADERAEMLEGLGLGEGALPRFVSTAYHLLGLRTFLTTGEKESRAWTFRAGSKAPQCAGVIHTDFQRGFIRAEVIHWDELLELGSWNKAKDVGKLRVEGKDYEVVDGDVLEFRFNV